MAVKKYIIKRQGVGIDYQGFMTSQLKNNGVPISFSTNVKKMCCNTPLDASKKRMDMRDLTVFTIDCDTTQDRDDAISIKKTETGYMLGVHIADVSNFVPIGSILDAEAKNRGSSIYLPGLTIPMLPKFLSNDWCSLNAGEDKYAISIMMDLDREANVRNFSVYKSIIRSRVQGTYSEVNSLLLSRGSSVIRKKYACIKNELITLKYISEILRQRRRSHGAILVNKDNISANISDDEITLYDDDHGLSGKIIEEIMVFANRMMAKFYIENSLPTIFRAQNQLGQLAFYTYDLCGHASLALDDGYIHFTSPIRRLPDLVNHQVLSMYLVGCPIETIHYIFDNLLPETCDLATKRSRRAANLQLACTKYCTESVLRPEQEDTNISLTPGKSQLLSMIEREIHD